MEKSVINLLTIFPDAVKSYLSVGMLGKAGEKELVEYNVVDLRDFAENRHRQVDDIPYGGGPGMVMMAPVVVSAIESLKCPGEIILMSPAGEKFTQQTAKEMSGRNLTFICGRYAGVDERVKKYIHREISVGDYILSGGELAALTVLEASVRLTPGVLGDARSSQEDKGYPLYTRPRNFRGMEVPEILLSGNHKKIDNFREQEAKYDYDD